MLNYQIKIPEINIFKKTVKEIVKVVKDLLFFRKWQFWVIVAILIVLSILSNSFILWIILNIILTLLTIYVIYINNKIRKSFWREFATINSWHYAEQGNPDQEHGIMFRREGIRSISNIVFGVIDGRQFRVFNYSFTIIHSNYIEKYNFTVFAFKFDGIFPHIYLNSKQNSYGINVGEVIPLSGEFDKKFTLSAPKKYEIEALEIFTPDVMVKLLDNEFFHDIEFVDSEMLIFTSGNMNSSEKLEKEFKKVLEIEDLLDEKLDRFKFSKIGNIPHNL